MLVGGCAKSNVPHSCRRLRRKRKKGGRSSRPPFRKRLRHQTKLSVLVGCFASSEVHVRRRIARPRSRPCALSAMEAIGPVGGAALLACAARSSTVLLRAYRVRWWQARGGVPGCDCASAWGPRPPGYATGLTDRGFAGTAGHPSVAGPIVIAFPPRAGFFSLVSRARQAIGRLS